MRPHPSSETYLFPHKNNRLGRSWERTCFVSDPWLWHIWPCPIALVYIARGRSSDVGTLPPRMEASLVPISWGHSVVRSRISPTIWPIILLRCSANYYVPSVSSLQNSKFHFMVCSLWIRRYLFGGTGSTKYGKCQIPTICVEEKADGCKISKMSKWEQTPPAQPQTQTPYQVNGVLWKVESFLHKRAQNTYSSIHRLFYFMNSCMSCKNTVFSDGVGEISSFCPVILLRCSS